MLLLSKISGSAIKNFSSPAFMQEVPYFSLISRQSVLLSELQSAVEPRKALFSRCRHTHCSVHVSGGDDDDGGGGDDDDGEDGDGDVGEDGGDDAATSFCVMCMLVVFFLHPNRKITNLNFECEKKPTAKLCKIFTTKN